MTTHFLFAYALWLWLLPVFIVLGVVLWRFSAKRAARRLELFLSSKLAREAMQAGHRRGKLLRFILMIGVLGFLVLALARPLSGPRSEKKERKGFDFVIVLDVSKSMLVEDVTPNRLDAIKTELEAWFKHLAGDRVGLVLFAGDAFVQAPLTSDFEALTLVLQQSGPKSISQGGTNLPKAIEMATNLLKQNETGSRFMLIISDGGNLEGDAIAAARQAHNTDQVTIFTLGVGTLAGGKVPNAVFVRGKDGSVQRAGAKSFLRDEYGLEAFSRLEERNLQSVAQAGGGRYAAFNPGINSLETWYNQNLLPLARKTQKIDISDYDEWFQIPIGLAILLLVIEPLIPLIRKPKPVNGISLAGPNEGKRGVRKITRQPVLSLLLILVLGGLCVGKNSAYPVDEADALLKAGKKDEAVQAMQKAVQLAPSDVLLFYNYGMTLYRAERFEESITVFQNVESTSGDEAIQAQAELQMANAQYRLGERLKTKGTLTGAALSMERSLGYYEGLNKTRSTKESRTNQQAAAFQLETLLVTLGSQRRKMADDATAKNDLATAEKAYRDTLQAFNRVAEINPKNEKVKQDIKDVEKALVDNLTKQAQLKAAAADALPPPKDEATSKAVLAKRQESVQKFEAALEYKPDDQALKQGRQEQMNKMSDQLTNEAAAKAAPLLTEGNLPPKQRKEAETILPNLEQALQLNPDNQKAKDLQKQLSDKVESSLLAEGENLLKAAEKQKDTESKLSAVSRAAADFQQVVDKNPQSQPAKEGLKKAQDQLPDLYAKAAEAGVKQAEAALKPPADKGAAKPEAPSAKQLQQAVGLLEKSTQNYAMAIAQKPDPAYQAGLEKAQAMLSDSRDQLDKNMQARDANAGEAPPEGETAQNAPAEGEQPGKQGGKLQSLTDLHGGSNKPVTDDNFWNKKFRDW